MSVETIKSKQIDLIFIAFYKSIVLSKCSHQCTILNIKSYKLTLE